MWDCKRFASNVLWTCVPWTMNELWIGEKRLNQMSYDYTLMNFRPRCLTIKQGQVFTKYYLYEPVFFTFWFRPIIIRQSKCPNINISTHFIHWCVMDPELSCLSGYCSSCGGYLSHTIISLLQLHKIILWGGNKRQEIVL